MNLCYYNIMINDTKAKNNNYYFVTISMVAATAGILFGYGTGIIAGAILFISHDFHLTALMNGTLVSALLFGALVGAACSGALSDALGRKVILAIAAGFFVIGSMIAAVSPSLPLLIIGRILVGVAIGVASYAAPLYISEIAPPKFRGVLVSLNQLAINIGIIIAYIVNYVFAQSAAWRWMFGLGVVPAILLLVGMIFLPRSPRWLIIKGHHNKALAVLRRIRGGNREVDHEVSEIRAMIDQSQKGKAQWYLLFSKTIRPVVIIGVVLAIMQQVTGINTILYYAPTIFSAGQQQSYNDAMLTTMGIGVILLLFTIIALPLIDIVGRRKLLLSGLLGMTLALLTMSWSFDHSGSGLAGILLHAAILLYIACFAFSLGPVVWLMIAEIYPLKVRGLGASLATGVNWLSNAIIAFTFLSIVKSIGVSYTFLLYSFMCVLSLLFVYFLVPETKGVTLERIEANLFQGKKWRYLGQDKLNNEKNKNAL